MKAAYVKRLRKRLGLTQVQFANRIGFTQSTVSKWERGKPISRLGKLMIQHEERQPA